MYLYPGTEHYYFDLFFLGVRPRTDFDALNGDKHELERQDTAACAYNAHVRSDDILSLPKGLIDTWRNCIQDLQCCIHCSEIQFAFLKFNAHWQY